MHALKWREYTPLLRAFVRLQLLSCQAISAMNLFRIAAGIVLFAGALLAAQDGLRVDVRLVNIYATVMDSSGRYVEGLKKSDFIVEEDGRRQILSHFDHNQDTPVSVGIVLDTSGSMRLKLDTATDAVDRFVRTIHPDDDIFLMGFDSAAYLLQDFTSDRSKLRKALRYADSEAADVAKRVILHGSVDGLTAEDALQAVLATSGLEHTLRAGDLLVSMPAAAR